ncbi:hypothetical protein FQZ97_836740 [compost metagenome]
MRDQQRGQQLAHFLHVFLADHVTAARGHQQRRHVDLRQVGVDIVFMEAVEAGQDCALVAGVQPLRAQAQLVFGPGRTETAHAFRIDALLGQPDRIDVPRQLRRIGAAARPRHRRIDQYQPRQPSGLAACGADADARAHRMADDGIALQPERFGKRDHVGSLRIEAVIQLRAGLRQAAATHVEHIGIELPPELLADEAPRDRRAGDARHDDHGIALRARTVLAAIAQVVLADAIGVDIGAVEEGAGRHEWLLQ